MFIGVDLTKNKLETFLLAKFEMLCFFVCFEQLLIIHEGCNNHMCI